MESCHNLTSLAASCAAVKKVGGVTERVWIGSKRMFLQSAETNPYFVFDDRFTANNVWWLHVEDTTALNGTELSYFEGLRFKNSGSFEVVAGENVNAITQNLNMVLFHYSQSQIAKLEQLLLSQDLIAFVLTEANQVKVFGIDKYENGSVRTWDGLKTISGTGADIVELQGEVGVQIQLQATLLNMPIILDGVYNLQGDTYDYDVAAIVQVLNSMSVNNA